MSKEIICYDKDKNPIKVNPDQLQFRPAVYGILIEKDKILLTKNWDGYDFPGGGIKKDETIEESLKREFNEETGLEIELIKPIECKTSFFNPNYSKKYDGQYWNCPCIYFLVKRIGGEISKKNFSESELDYADEAEWIDIKDIKNIKFYNSIDSVSLITKTKEDL